MKVLSINGIIDERRLRGDRIKHAQLMKPLQELITLEDAGALMQKITLDVAEGEAEVPLLYEPIYQRRENRAFPKWVDTNFLTSAGCVFLEHLEAGEIEFGAMAAGVPGAVPIITWATGFEYTEDMVEFNQQWDFESLNRAFGQAYNALLNHLHIGPILSFPYGPGNQSPATNTQPDFLLEVRETIKMALQKCVLAGRTPTILLASIADKFTIEDALNVTQDTSNRTIQRIGAQLQYLIYYDGWSVQVGKKKYVYPGCTPGKCYLIRPKVRMIELVKHGLEIAQDNADVSRLIEKQVVGRTRRGLFADIEQSVEEVTLPTPT